MTMITTLPEVLAEGLLALFKLHNNDLKFRDEARFITGGLHLRDYDQSMSVIAWATGSLAMGRVATLLCALIEIVLHLL